MIAYQVSSGKQTLVVGGERSLLVSNAGGALFTVFRNLAAGHRYVFSVSAVTPAGVGPAASSRPMVPGG